MHGGSQILHFLVFWHHPSGCTVHSGLLYINQYQILLILILFSIPPTSSRHSHEHRSSRRRCRRCRCHRRRHRRCRCRLKTIIQLTTLTLYQPSPHQPSPHCRWLKEDIFRNWAVPVCERVTPVREQASSSQCPFANWFNWASRSQMVFKYSSHSQMGTHNCARIRTVAKKT